MTIPHNVRNFARQYFIAKVTRNGNYETMSFSGEWDTKNDMIIVRSILGETFHVPVAKSWI